MFSKSMRGLPSISPVCRAAFKRSETTLSGVSHIARDIRAAVTLYAKLDEPVLITGETGVGKNRIARMIHNESGRKGEFVVVDVPSVAENLFGSEMFGHKKGAFTDASRDKTGLVSIAEGGTLVLDEISEIPFSTQSKLLRFIETKTFRELGGTEEKKANVRIIAATNRNLNQAIAENDFRRDLYYRLQVLELNIPPLRNRKEDIFDLVMEHTGYLNGKILDKSAWDILYEHEWPGNIRELLNVVKRAGISCTSPICGDQLWRIISASGHRPVHLDKSGTIFNSDDSTIEKLWILLKTGSSFWEAVKQPFMERDVKRDEVKEIINRGLKETRGKYKGLVTVFNMSENDYHKFMTFLRDNRLR